MMSKPASAVKRALHQCVDEYISQLKNLMCQQQPLLYLLGCQRYFNSTMVVFTQDLNKHLIIKINTSICIKIRFWKKDMLLHYTVISWELILK